MYDTAVGKWISEDPIGLMGGDPNFVRYVSNLPLSSVDPLGLAELTKPQQALLDKFTTSDSFLKLTKEQQDLFMSAITGAIEKLTDKLATRLLLEIKTVSIQPGLMEMAMSMKDLSGVDVSNDIPGGAFDARLGIFYGVPKHMDTWEVLHEFGHALDKIEVDDDGVVYKHSSLQAWKDAWGLEVRGSGFAEEELNEAKKKGAAKAEIDRLTKLAYPVSKYACKNGSEGFAEFFAHAILNPKDAKVHFAGAYSFMVKYGILPK